MRWVLEAVASPILVRWPPTLDVTPVITAAASAAGTAGWFRVADSTGAVVFDGLCGAGNQMVFDNPVIALGQTCNLVSGTVTQPAQ